MRKKKWSTILACITLTVATLVGVALAAGTTGSQSVQPDPLVTLSYVNAALDTLKAQVQTQIEDRFAKLDSELDGAAKGVFVPLEVPAGQIVTLAEGAQIILRTGTAETKMSLIDLTEGTIPWGSMEANHLYIATEAGQTVVVTSDALFLVQGGAQVQQERP